jgi:hypothetical protein
MTTTFTLQSIKDRCRIDADTGCWHWSGAKAQGKYPRIHAPDYSDGGTMRVQTGLRAAWQASTGKAIPTGHRVYHRDCSNHTCVNPAHIACGPTADWGKQVAKTGAWKNQPKRIIANRATGRKRSLVTPSAAHYIATSSSTGRALALELGLSNALVSRVRRSKHMASHAANPFAGLLK